MPIEIGKESQATHGTSCMLDLGGPGHHWRQRRLPEIVTAIAKYPETPTTAED
jgi:hypothetical protein